MFLIAVKTKSSSLFYYNSDTGRFIANKYNADMFEEKEDAEGLLETLEISNKVDIGVIKIKY